MKAKKYIILLATVGSIYAVCMIIFLSFIIAKKMGYIVFNQKQSTTSNSPGLIEEPSTQTVNSLSKSVVREKSSSVSPDPNQLIQGRVITNSIGMKLVYMPARWFIMGSDRIYREPIDGVECSPPFSEKPPHIVKITKGFYMGTCEVTQGQWKAIMNSTVTQQRDKREKENPDTIYLYNGLFGVGANYPMYYVSWYEAVEFCEKLSQKEGRLYRLPTEAEWELCRESERDSHNANYNGEPQYYNSRGVNRHKTTPVGSFNPNYYGLYDMCGNVYEWCSDYYADNYYSNFPSHMTYLPNGRTKTEHGEAIDPQGPATGTSRVKRGGSWLSDYYHIRKTHRSHSSPENRTVAIGFRVVLEP